MYKVMLKSLILLFVILSLASSIGKADMILGWEPLPSELPSTDYDAFFLGNDPQNWIWSESYSDIIRDVYVAAPIHPNPYQPIIEYDGNHDSYDVSITISSPGVYAIKIDFKDDWIKDQVQFLYVDAYLAKKGKENHNRHKKLTQPNQSTIDLIIVENPISDNGAIANAAEVIDDEVRASDVAEAIQAIDQAYKNNGNKPVSIEIVAHGTGDAISIGAGISAIGMHPDKELVDNSLAVQDFITQLSGKIEFLTLKGCSVADGVDAPGRNHLMERLADGLGTTVYAWDGDISWTAPKTIFGVTFREGYASIDVNGKLHEIIPEPASLTLVVIGLGYASWKLRRKKAT